MLTRLVRDRRTAVACVALIALVGLAPFGPRSDPLAGLVLREVLPRTDAKLACDIPQAGLEATFGLRIESLTLAADGGLIDLRFRVVDGDRAASAIHHEGPMELRVIRNQDGVEASRSWMGHQFHADLVPGRVYYELLVNEGGVFAPGDVVTLEFGKVRLENVRLG